MIHRILAAVDDSDHAPEVVAAAGEVAARFGASLHLFTALSIPPDIPAAAHNAPDDAERGSPTGRSSGCRVSPPPFPEPQSNGPRSPTRRPGAASSSAPGASTWS